MAYVNFAKLKTDVSIIRILDVYGIALKRNGEQLRGCCPICDSDNKRAFVVTPSKESWYCFKCEEGGDIIALVAKLQGVRPRDAALDIQERCLGEAPKPLKNGGDLQPLAYLLEEHDAVQDLGIPPEIALQLGCGYAKKGIMRGRVAFPLRDESGKLLAYCGYSSKDGTLKLPKFQTEDA